MNFPKYPYKTNPTFLDFEFNSDGPKGLIQKVARFTMVQEIPPIYNFGFGDLDQITGDINDTVVSNNGDGDKILATTAGIICDFVEYFPKAFVFIEGTSPSRTRRYQMGISKHWKEVKENLEIYGYKAGKWEQFQPGNNYQAFMGRRKLFYNKQTL